ncbi:hypothetical protein Leryth_011982 [Lithospermum erythrorhizon]|nr:hypothetical protein Leryth_011982 [Lithospermum erythrorhizon]
MDTQQVPGYGANGTSSVQTTLIEPEKFDLKSSPSSPFSAHLDSENFTTLSDSHEQQSTSEKFSAASPSSYFSIDYNHQNQRLSPPVICHQAGGTSFPQDVNHGPNILDKLQELETALMGPDEEDEEMMIPYHYVEENPQLLANHGLNTWSHGHQGLPFTQSQSSQFHKLDGVPEGEKQLKEIIEKPLEAFHTNNVRELLIACARAFSERKLVDFDKLVENARNVVSITGDPIQRLGAYMLEGLVARKESSGTNIYRTLRCKEPASKDLLSYMHILYEICPYLKFGYMAANGAIAEACRNEVHIHIVDFQICQGTQWITLLQALANRPGGVPHVRITGIDDPVSKHARGDGLVAVGRRLTAISEKCNIPVDFHPLSVYAPDVTIEMLDVRPGEALAVNFPLQLHHTPDESVDVNNPRDALIRAVRSLCPKVVTLVEQESNTNTAPFVPRFIEALDYYSAMFESLDVTLPRDKKERISVEQHCLARDIVNIIACEGSERVERHELLGKWKSRFTMAGFQQYPLSSYMNSVIKDLLRSYSEHYTLLEKGGAMLLGWKERSLVSASAWH